MESSLSEALTSIERVLNKLRAFDFIYHAGIYKDEGQYIVIVDPFYDSKVDNFNYKTNNISDLLKELSLYYMYVLEENRHIKFSEAINKIIKYAHIFLHITEIGFVIGVLIITFMLLDGAGITTLVLEGLLR